MANNTPNLDLYKKDPVADGNDTFNIQTMLNDNWDKIDADKAAQDAALTAHLADAMQQGVHGIATTADINLYVRTDGNDDNDGSADDSAHAYQTIGAAIAKIPQVVNHTVTVNVAAGTYDEKIAIKGYTGLGGINVNGNTADLDTTHIVNKVEIINCICSVTVNGFFTITTTESSFNITNSVNAILNYCDSTVTSANSGFYAFCSNVYLNHCSCSNKSGGWLYAQVNSKVALINCYAGSGNAVGITANYATVTVNGTMPQGTTPVNLNCGGQVFTAPAVQVPGTAVPQKIQCGTTHVSISSAGSQANTPVTFGTAFKSSPGVIVGIVEQSVGAVWITGIASTRTPTGFTLSANAGAAGGVDFQWIAIGN